jgi:hypothetical protein
VEIRWDDPVAMVVQGFLVDISHSGFRMRHSCQALEAGTIVNFVHDEAQGKARVVWTRLTAPRTHSSGSIAHAESGFLILE